MPATIHHTEITDAGSELGFSISSEYLDGAYHSTPVAAVYVVSTVDENGNREPVENCGAVKFYRVPRGWAYMEGATRGSLTSGELEGMLNRAYVAWRRG
jgi:hypothetical protein